MLQHAVVGQQPVASPQTLEASPQHTIVQPPTAAKKHIAPQQPITVQQQPTALLVQQPTATQQPTVFHPTVTPVPRLAAPMSGPRPTQRVIQYAAKNSKAHSSPNPGIELEARNILFAHGQLNLVDNTAKSFNAIRIGRVSKNTWASGDGGGCKR